MILLRQDCLVFKMSSGEKIPCSAEKVTIELMGETAELVDQQLIKDAAETVLHYFKNELNRDSVSVAEFSLALEQVLRGLGLEVKSSGDASPASAVTLILDSDLGDLARESGKAIELIFFPRLRKEMQILLQRTPGLVRFKGLRNCVMDLTGAKRWTLRCQALSDQIVEYLRCCLKSEEKAADCAMLIH